MLPASAQASEAAVNSARPADEEAAAAEAVGQRAGGEHDAGEREGVGVDDPLQTAQVRVQVARDVGERGVHHGDVEHEHRGREADHGEGHAASHRH